MMPCGSASTASWVCAASVESVIAIPSSVSRCGASPQSHWRRAVEYLTPLRSIRYLTLTWTCALRTSEFLAFHRPEHHQGNFVRDIFEGDRHRHADAHRLGLEDAARGGGRPPRRSGGGGWVPGCARNGTPFSLRTGSMAMIIVAMGDDAPVPI